MPDFMGKHGSCINNVDHEIILSLSVTQQGLCTAIMN